MICNNCNNEYDDSSNFCPYCGTRRVIQQAETASAPVYQAPQNYAQPVAGPQVNYQANPYDIPSVLLCIISFFKPFIGLILYLSWSKEYPRRAKAVGTAALIGAVLKFLSLILSVVLSATVFSDVIMEIAEEIMWYF